MFGTYRFLLACMVVCGHTRYLLFDRINWLGPWAVFGFYVLSGYLMTRVLHETYGYGPSAAVRFLGNRALRIYPAYWAAIALMVGLLVAIPGIAGKQSDMVFLPQDARQWFHSIVILGLDWKFTPRLVPPSWSLHVELTFYMLMALGLSRTRTLTALWFAASLAWTVHALVIGVQFGERFGTVIGGSLPFAAGAIVYHLPRLPTALRNPAGLCAALAFLIHAVAPGFVYTSTTGVGFYVSLGLAIATAAALRDTSVAPPWRRLDNRLGDLAYPVFLLHMPIAYFVQWMLPAATALSEEWFFLTLPPVLLASLVLDRLVEKPIEKARARVRGAGIGALKAAETAEPSRA